MQLSVDTLKQEIAKVVVGQEQMVELLLTAVLADGHVIIEGVPGVAKTLTAKLLSKSISVGFSRIQFTPDLMPSDVIGTSIFNPKETSFQFKQGPIFSNIVLIDEINRAPAKTQAALFEVMEERQVTVDGQTYLLAAPFMVVATQNPIEQEGTYHLPEAQLDRFLFKINVTYPTIEQEFHILYNHHQATLNSMLEEVKAVISAQEIEALRKQVRTIRIEEKLINFITSIVANTRNHKSIYLGASPRASIGILNGAKALAAMRGRDFVTPEDIIYIIPPVLRHRIVLTPEKEMEGASTDDVIQQVIQSIEVPR
ncbi:MoxR family ATPase [Paraflavitalea speifideaquila]|uniref:AAA family ATPase n=1 Tax=Paraflavitalea speifideaquila TaxID=3076558 RepID=UPI0028E1C9D2|nr:MoxR family ATPase [Paraflavitalea speifideiaquila]